jgi:hypothetical protein
VNWIARSNQLAQQRGIGAGFELFAKQGPPEKPGDFRTGFAVLLAGIPAPAERSANRPAHPGASNTWALCNENTAAIGSSGFDSPIGNGHAVAQPGRAEAFAGED